MVTLWAGAHCFQAAAERQLREKGEMPANGAAEDAPAADAAGAAASKDNKGADVASASGTAASGGGKEAVARKIQATTKEILSRVAGAGEGRAFRVRCPAIR